MGVDLKGLQPTQKEVIEAKRIISALDEKGKKSSKACLAHFLKTNPQDTVEKGIRGNARDEALEKFIVWQTRQKNAKKDMVSAKSSGEKKANTSSTTGGLKNKWMWKSVRRKGHIGDNPRS